MKNSRVKFFVVTFFLLFLVTSVAGAYTFDDATKVQVWQGNTASSVWQDVVGTDAVFNTSGANLSDNKLTIFTHYNPGKDNYGGYGVYTADLFIDNDSNETFDYAIRLDTNGIGKVYANPTYNTSVFYFGGTQYHYGGRYNEASPSATPVWATSADTGITSVLWSSYDFNSPDNQVEVNLAGLNLSSNWSFVWGTGTCSNDALSGNVKVPEPSILLLLGVGLIGLAGVRRKFKE